MTHELLWAPWRLGYVQGNKEEAETPSPGVDLLPGADPKCFLCRGAADPGDEVRHIVLRTPHCITLLNRYPYNNGHLLVAPRLHRARLDQLTSAEQIDSMGCITRMVGLLEEVLNAEGFNIGLNLGEAAGAGLPGHLHWHIVPRWKGDSNFMPSVAGVKVIPQALDALWEILHKRVECST